MSFVMIHGGVSASHTSVNDILGSCEKLPLETLVDKQQVRDEGT